MKAIYINLDPYNTTIVAWINGGFVGPAPTFQPLPLAVTIPLGETPVLIVPAASAFSPEGPIQGEGDWDMVSASVDGVEFTFNIAPLDENSVIASALKPGLSSVVPNATYAVTSAGTSGTIRLTANVIPSASEAPAFEIPFTVFVRRETASGPVDLVDFTPPAAAIAAGTDLKGCTFDGNAIEAAADTGVLSAPAGS
jgi:hypothetical protein